MKHIKSYNESLYEKDYTEYINKIISSLDDNGLSI